MPRQARQLCEKGYYHVIARGVNKEIIFREEGDYLKYIGFLKKYSEEQEIILVAYCLMSNHVHLLIQDQKDHMSAFMQKLGMSYAQYYNKRYERTGHLFQNRFKSQLIGDDFYLTTAYRYILKNPEKAGIAPASEYRWSSYHDFSGQGGLTDTRSVEQLIGDSDAFNRFMGEAASDLACLNFEYSHSDDSWAAEVAEEIVGNKDLRKLSKDERNCYLRMLIETGLSIRQIERITGVKRGVIQNLSAREADERKT